MRHWIGKLAGVLVLSCAGLTGRAQSMELGLEIFSNNVMGITNTTLNNSAVEASMENARSSSRSTAASRTRARASSTSYVPTAAARQQALGAQSASMSLSGAMAQKFVTLYGPGGEADYAALYRKATAGTGLRDNDIGDVAAAYLLASYQLAHGASPLVPAASARAVRTQFVPFLGPSLTGKPATVLAGQGEYLKLQTALLYLANQRPTPKLRQDVANRLKERMHFDVMAVRLTSKGFAKK